MIVGGIPQLISRSVYRSRHYRHSLADVWMRRDAALRLKRAAELLPRGLSLVCLDGWRPIELQAELYEEYRQKIHAQTALTGEELDRETRRFVSAPDPDPDIPPPHLTGGTIDLTLGDLHGVELDMGGEFDELSDRSRSDHYESAESPEAIIYRDRRRLLTSVMTHVGFSNYPEEWWHFDIGNQWHHSRVGGPARYGAVMRLPVDRIHSSSSLARAFEGQTIDSDLLEGSISPLI